jgi:hypothetical protein
VAGTAPSQSYQSCNGRGRCLSKMGDFTTCDSLLRMRPLRHGSRPLSRADRLVAVSKPHARAMWCDGPHDESRYCKLKCSLQLNRYLLQSKSPLQCRLHAYLHLRVEPRKTPIGLSLIGDHLAPESNSHSGCTGRHHVGTIVPSTPRHRQA